LKTLIIYALMLVSGTAGGFLLANLDRLRSRGMASSPPVVTVEQLQSLAHLLTTRVTVSDVLETRLDGWTGGIRAALLVHGDFIVSIDLSRAEFEQMDHGARSAILVLPQPQVSRPRLDHDRTRLFAVTWHGLWQVGLDQGRQSDLVNRSYAQAQEQIAVSSGHPQWLGHARRQAEQVLGSFFDALGWEITLRWTDS
jgi:hypothetical protein